MVMVMVRVRVGVRVTVRVKVTVGTVQRVGCMCAGGMIGRGNEWLVEARDDWSRDD